MSEFKVGDSFYYVPSLTTQDPHVICITKITDNFIVAGNIKIKIMAVPAYPKAVGVVKNGSYGVVYLSKSDFIGEPNLPNQQEKSTNSPNHLIHIMNEYNLSTSDVARILERKKNTIEAWLSVGQTRPIPSHMMALLKLKLKPL